MPVPEPVVSAFLDSCLRERFGNRLPDLHLRSDQGQYVISGHLNTYYGLQLTLSAVNLFLRQLNADSPQEVAVNVRVGDSASDFHGVCRR